MRNDDGSLLSKEEIAIACRHRDLFVSQVRAANADESVIHVLVRDGKDFYAKSTGVVIGGDLLSDNKMMPMDVPKLERLKAILEKAVEDITAKIAGLSVPPQRPFNPEQN